MTWPKKLACPPPNDNYVQASESLAYVTGAVMGDGYLGKNVVHLAVTDPEFALAFKEHLHKQFGKEPAIRTYASRALNYRPIVRVSLYSKIARDFLASLDAGWVRSLSIKQKKMWLRGAWDAEGCIAKKKSSSWSVRFGVKNEEFAKLYYDILREILPEAAPYIWLPKNGEWTVAIGRLVDVVRFYDMVQPTIVRKRILFEAAASYYSAYSGPTISRGRWGERRWKMRDGRWTNAVV